MKETRFISQNKEKWLESEALLDNERKDPGKLSNLFTQVVDDLSYSRTYYPHRSVRVYLNKIARQYFSIIYNNQRERKGKFRMFWLDELPQVVIHCRTPLLISLVVFLLALSIGVFSSAKDPDFTSTILGPGYVSMTKENISKGDPMAVYKKGHQLDMFLGITLNNLMVAFRTYVFGVFLSIGTLAILLYNGIMVGCFQYFFVENGLFAESALTIWLHGTLEISAIIIAGGAGLTLGSGLVFPGTYSRFQAFQISAIRSLKLMLGITPVIITAGIIESFLTRYTETPDFIRLLLILLSAAFIIGYFVVYPWYKSKRGFEIPIQEVRLQPAPYVEASIHTIKTNADILKDSFQFYKENFTKIIKWIAVVAVGVTTCDMVLHERIAEYRSGNDWLANFFAELFFAMKTPSPLFIAINSLATAIVLYRVWQILNISNPEIKKKNTPVDILTLTLIISPVYFLILVLESWGVFLVSIGFFMIIMMGYIQVLDVRRSPFHALRKVFSLGSNHFTQFAGLHFTLLLTSVTFLLILSAPLIYLYINIFEWNFAKSDFWASHVIDFISTWIKEMAFFLILPIIASCATYLYYVLTESSDATHLKSTISQVASKYQKRNPH